MTVINHKSFRFVFFGRTSGKLRCDTEFCSPLIYMYNQNLLQIIEIENEYKVLLQNTCCARPADSIQGGYTESDNRLKLTLHGKALRSHKD